MCGSGERRDVSNAPSSRRTRILWGGGFLVLVAVFFGVVLVAGLGNMGEEEDSSPPAQQQEPPPAPPPPQEEQTSERGAQQQPVSFQGHGSQAKQLNLSRGSATFAFSYRDDPSQEPGQYWSIELLDSAGNIVNTIQTDTGADEGNKVVQIPNDDTYTVNIYAPGGSWALEVR
jgi:hypothetical protein